MSGSGKFSGVFSGITDGGQNFLSETTRLPGTDRGSKGKWVDYVSPGKASGDETDLGAGEPGGRVTTEDMDHESGRTEGPLLKESGVAGDNSPVSMSEDELS